MKPPREARASGALRWGFSEGREPERDLAREEELLRAAAAGRPVLACWSWTGPVVVLGHGQPEEDADLELCRSRGIPVVRRITGGTGIVHARDLAASLALPAGHPAARTIHGSYALLLDILETALGACGVAVERPAPGPPGKRGERSPICFEDALGETLARSGRKVAGCAQARRRDAVLVHAHLHLTLDTGLYAAVFGVPEARVRRSVGAVEGVTPGRLARAVARAAGDRLGLPVKV